MKKLPKAVLVEPLVLRVFGEDKFFNWSKSIIRLQCIYMYIQNLIFVGGETKPVCCSLLHRDGHQHLILDVTQTQGTSHHPDVHSDIIIVITI